MLDKLTATAGRGRCRAAPSAHTPPEDGQRGQQTEERAGRGGGGVTQVRVAALEGETGNLEETNRFIDEAEETDKHQTSRPADSAAALIRHRRVGMRRHHGVSQEGLSL